MLLLLHEKVYQQRWSHSTHSPLISYTTFTLVGISLLSGACASASASAREGINRDGHILLTHLGRVNHGVSISHFHP